MKSVETSSLIEPTCSIMCVQCCYCSVHFECYLPREVVLPQILFVSVSLSLTLSQVPFCSVFSLSLLKAQDSADLVLLIDGSENIGAANFPYVRDLAMRIIERLDVGRDTVRVAVALYDASPQIQFYLNSYDSKASVLEAVKGLSYSGGDESNLGAALEEVADSLLSQTVGGRADEGVPQMVIVISAGPSTDDTGAGDRAIKRAGIITFGLAIGDTATADLEAVATDKSFVLSAPDFRSVAGMGDQLLPYVNGVVQRTIIVQTEITEGM